MNADEATKFMNPSELRDRDTSPAVGLAIYEMTEKSDEIVKTRKRVMKS